MNNKKKEQSEVILFFAFMLTSARGLLKEPLLYGPSRLLSTVIMLYELLSKQFDYEDKDISDLVEDLEELRLLCMIDEDAFVAAIEEKINVIDGKILQNREQNGRKKVLSFYLSILTNARALIDEPQLYGSLRLLETIVQSYDLLRDQFGFEDPDISDLLKDIDELKSLCLKDETGFVYALDSAIIHMVQVVK